MGKYYQCEMSANYGFVSSFDPISEWGLDIEKGAISVDTRMETNIEGFFAAGDIVRFPGKVKLIAVGFGEASTVVNNAMVYINPSAKLSPGHKRWYEEVAILATLFILWIPVPVPIIDLGMYQNF